MKNLTIIFSFITIWSTNVFAQISINGTVKDKDGIAIPHANVHIKNSKIKAKTDSTGKFTLSGSIAVPYTLEIKAYGFTTYSEVVTDAQKQQFNVSLQDDLFIVEEVVIKTTARRRVEVVQDIPIPITVISGKQAEEAGAFNVNRLKELVPSVQLYSSNARNTTLNIRGLGSTFGLTNDGIDPGVGFYVDGVYHARPAATSLDFIDVDQIEVLRGPQGTLFGKNTTAGAFNITTKKPSFDPSTKVELSYGNYNYIQAKASTTGQLAKNLATRLSFSGTQRQGTLYNPNDQQHYNGLNNLGFKGQLLYTPTSKLEILLSGDNTTQRPDGAALVVAGVAKTERSAYRQYDKIISDLGYQKTIIDPFSRKIYSNSPWRQDQSIGGLSLNVDYKIGKGTLTSTSAWRYWNWDPSNDRDFTEVSALTKSSGTSKHDQYSQELRFAGNINDNLSGVVGTYALGQNLRGIGQAEEVGKDQWRFLQPSGSGADTLWKTPGLLNNYGKITDYSIKSLSTAAFAQVDWKFLDVFHVLPGIRFTYDQKDVTYNSYVYGGLQTNNAALIKLKESVYKNQNFAFETNNQNLTGSITLSYRPNEKYNIFGTFSTGYKPVGVNVGGLPTVQTGAAKGRADSSLAQVKPEYVQNFELGIKTQPVSGAILNLSVFNTDIDNYQTSVASSDLTVNRGYLANAEKVNVKGFEIDGSYRLKKFLSINAAVAYTDGKYVTFKNAPLPLEETGHKELINNVSTSVYGKDISGTRLPGISKWNLSLGAELSTKGNLLGKSGRFFVAGNFSYRTEFSSSSTPSDVLVIKGYGLVNARAGFRADDFGIFIWSRNLTNTNYYDQLQAAAGNSGLYVGVLGDPRTYGVTLSYNIK